MTEIIATSPISRHATPLVTVMSPEVVAPSIIVPTREDRGLPDNHFGLIHADPAWAFINYSKKAQIPTIGKQPYKAISFEELLALPIKQTAAKNCVLVMWTISSHVDQAIALGTAWGFKFKSLGVIWCKTQKHAPTKPKMGMGKWVRQEAEITLIFTRGKPKRLDAGIRQMIFAPATKNHSEKPTEIYSVCERLAAGPYLDLFGRCSKPGWTVWGDEATKLDPITAEPSEPVAPTFARPAPSNPAGEIIPDFEDVIAAQVAEETRPTPTQRVEQQRSRHAPKTL